jgi:hypothetical protein
MQCTHACANVESDFVYPWQMLHLTYLFSFIYFLFDFTTTCGPVGDATMRRPLYLFLNVSYSTACLVYTIDLIRPVFFTITFFKRACALSFAPNFLFLMTSIRVRNNSVITINVNPVASRTTGTLLLDILVTNGLYNVMRLNS